MAQHQGLWAELEELSLHHSTSEPKGLLWGQDYQDPYNQQGGCLPGNFLLLIR